MAPYLLLDHPPDVGAPVRARDLGEGPTGVLDTATGYDHQRVGGLTVKVMPGAWEARIYPTASGCGVARSTPAPPEERDYSKCTRARALRTIRPFVVAHDLWLAVTTTYAKAVADPLEAAAGRRNYLRRLVRAVRRDHPEVERMPWLCVPEFHASGAIHDHFFLPEMARSHAIGKWGNGRADLAELPAVSDQRAFSEYVCKHFDTQPPGAQRYSHARGFPVEEHTFEVDDIHEARALADRWMMGVGLASTLSAPRFRSETRLYSGFETERWR